MQVNVVKPAASVGFLFIDPEVDLKTAYRTIFRVAIGQAGVVRINNSVAVKVPVYSYFVLIKG